MIDKYSMQNRLELAIKTNLFNKIDYDVVTNVFKNFFKRAVVKMLFPCCCVVRTKKQYMFHCQWSVAIITYWWLFPLQQVCMSEMCVS